LFVILATLGLTGAVLVPEVAEAHFVLQSPPAWMSQTSLGIPEKLGPCGDEDDGTDAATPTGIVTAVQQGQKITVTINEVIFHPGHYRIALAEDRSMLPAEPVVTPGDTACGTVPIDPSPTLPVLADGVFVHTAPFTAPQSFEITIPSTITCSHCTLQVIEFMSEHPLNNPGGCFYHHCADLEIRPATSGSDASTPPPGVDSGGGNSTDASGSGVPDAASVTDSGGGTGVTPGYAGGSTGTPSSSGCGCLVGRTGSSISGLVALGGIAVFLRRRKQRNAR
jgi:hypothetical protein